MISMLTPLVTSCQMIVRLHLSVTACFVNFPKTAKIPKFPLQKGRAEVAALTTGRDAVNDDSGRKNDVQEHYSASSTSQGTRMRRKHWKLLS
jgi:hypothetical protein